MSDDVTTTFARTLVDEWIRCGVGHAVIAPGSRSTPLALAIADRPELAIQVAIDERSAAFRALGIGKATGVPAILLCTSGTAAAHFAPAVIEADAARVPMLVCTADRPPELHGIDASQTIDQQHLYGVAARAFLDLGVPEASDNANERWRTLAATTVWTARGDAGHAPGPVHLNLPFREPLIPTGKPVRVGAGRPNDAPWIPAPAHTAQADPALVTALVEHVRENPYGIITAGWGAAVTPTTLRRFTRVAGWPVLADVLSNLRIGDDIIGGYEALVRAPGFTDAHKPTIALRLGGLLTSKATNEWLNPNVPQVFVDPYDTWIDARRPGMTRLIADAESLIGATADALAATPVGDDAARTAWVEIWTEADHAARTAIDKLLGSWDEPFDGRIARDLAAGIPDGATLFVASSMPVRDLDAFAAPRTGVAVYASRGANGIDGFASTVLGLAAATAAPIVGLCGDLAFLHDANGMLGAEEIPGLNAVIVVIDNNGGGIFSFLPQVDIPKHFERLWGTPHNRDLAAIGAAYGAVVSRVLDADDLVPVVETALAAGGLHVVIVSTDRNENVLRHREAWTAAARALDGAR